MGWGEVGWGVWVGLVVVGWGKGKGRGRVG